MTIELWLSGELQIHIWTSSQEFILGFLLACFVGIMFGVVMASSVIVRDFCDPWMSMHYSTPIIALGPLFILWFGIGVSSKVAVIFIVAVFPILINTFAGLATTDANLIEVARSFGSSPTQIFTKVRFPSALRFIIAGLRLGAQTREIMQGELLRIWRDARKTVVFVTHQIDEAVYLSDRVLVFTVRPGRIKEEVLIDPPRPRELTIKRTTEFVRYADRIGRLIEEEVRESLGREVREAVLAHR